MDNDDMEDEEKPVNNSRREASYLGAIKPVSMEKCYKLFKKLGLK
jgi:hypothetical protein